MAYCLHIRRSPKDLTLEEWLEAIERVDGVKRVESDMKAINPVTSQAITVPANKGDALILFETKGLLGCLGKKEWRQCIRFSNSLGTFKATPDLELPDNPLRIAAAKLAATLGAQIVGDEGEVYEWLPPI